jgi:hypothetical protein
LASASAAIALYQWLRRASTGDFNPAFGIEPEGHASIFEHRLRMRKFRWIDAVPAVGPAFMTHVQAPFGDVVALVNVSAELKRPFAQKALVKKSGVSHSESFQSWQRYNMLG